MAASTSRRNGHPATIGRGGAAALAATLALAALSPACKEKGTSAGDAAYSSADPDARYRLAERMGVTLATGRRFMAEVARTDEEKTRGLMFRKRMAPDDAMLFVYDRPMFLGVWMKNVELQIDVVFLMPTGTPEKLQVVHALEGLPPCRTDTCPTYPCPVPARYFLELPAYTLSTEGVRLGDIVTLERAP